MPTIEITQLVIYPVKSMRGMTLQSSQLDAMGLRWDRRWMLVDAQGRFLTGRQHPELLTIQPRLSEQGALSLEFPDGKVLAVPSPDAAAGRVPVTVWNDTVMASPVGGTCDDVLSAWLGEPCRLVFIEDDEVRQVDPAYAHEGDRTGFSDGFPLLLISEASLADLNSRLPEALPMSRFRPNLVVAGTEPFAEDDWQTFETCGVKFSVVKPCSRCVMTTVDAERGIRAGNEPLATLMTYRRQGNKVMFGQNVIHRGRGVLRVGAPVEVLPAD